MLVNLFIDQMSCMGFTRAKVMFLDCGSPQELECNKTLSYCHSSNFWCWSRQIRNGLCPLSRPHLTLEAWNYKSILKLVFEKRMSGRLCKSVFDILLSNNAHPCFPLRTVTDVCLCSKGKWCGFCYWGKQPITFPTSLVLKRCWIDHPHPWQVKEGLAAPGSDFL